MNNSPTNTPAGTRPVLAPVHRRTFLQHLLTGAAMAAVSISCKKTGPAVQGPLPEAVLPADPNLLPLNARFVAMGDSITVFHTVSGTVSSLNSTAYVPYALQLSGNKLYLPPGGDQGVPGNTTAQMIARMPLAIALKPRLMLLLGGTNDLQASVPAATVIANLGTMIASCRAINCKVLLLTVLPRFGGKKLSPADEAGRLELNTWIRAQQAADVTIADAETVMGNEALYQDGLHPNSRGALALGTLVAAKLDALLAPGPVISSLMAGTLFTTNPQLRGSGGTKAGASGQVADAFHLGASQSGGAAVTGAKASANGAEQQLISITGTYSGKGRYVELYQDHTATAPLNGDMVEGFADVEISTALVNVAGLYFQMQFYTAGYTATLATAYSIVPIKDEKDSLDLQPGRYVLRTAPLHISGGSPAITANVISILFKDQDGPAPVAAAVKVHQLGIRKVPADV